MNKILEKGEKICLREINYLLAYSFTYMDSSIGKLQKDTMIYT